MKCILYIEDRLKSDSTSSDDADSSQNEWNYPEFVTRHENRPDLCAANHRRHVSARAPHGARPRSAAFGNELRPVGGRRGFRHGMESRVYDESVHLPP